MSEQQVIEGNKLIAEFMGGEVINNIFICNEGTESYHERCLHHYNISQASYHSSWDWLMPCIEKIATIPNKHDKGLFKYMVNVELDPITGIVIEDMYKRNFPLEEEGFYFEMHDYSFIENTWFAVVEFIKWYNQNN